MAVTTLLCGRRCTVLQGRGGGRPSWHVLSLERSAHAAGAMCSHRRGEPCPHRPDCCRKRRKAAVFASLKLSANAPGRGVVSRPRVVGAYQCVIVNTPWFFTCAIGCGRLPLSPAVVVVVRRRQCPSASVPVRPRLCWRCVRLRPLPPAAARHHSLPSAVVPRRPLRPGFIVFIGRMGSVSVSAAVCFVFGVVNWRR